MSAKMIPSDATTSRKRTSPEARASGGDKTVRQGNFGQGTVLTPRSGHRLAYERVSTADQQLGRQTDALDAAGFDRLFTDHGVSGTKPAQERPGMAALLEFARTGDTVVVLSIDRLGRSTRDVLELLATFKARGIGLHVLNLGRLEGPLGELLVAILASVAQLERDQLAERTRAGIAAARLRGSQPGRPRSLTASQQKLALELHRAGRPTGEIAEVLGGCSRRTVQRAIVAAKAAQ